MNITHENLLKNGWKCSDIKNQRYSHPFYLDILLFLTKDYGINDNYMVQLLFSKDDITNETLRININCINMSDLDKLAHLLHKASAVSLMKSLLLSY